jgi:MFS family permease
MPLVGILASTFFLRSSTAVTSLALPWILNSQAKGTGAASIAIALCFCASITGVLSGGILVDRVGPSFAMRLAGICGAFSVSAVLLLYKFDLHTPLAVIVLFACVALFDAVAANAQDGRIPEVANFANIPLRRTVAIKSTIGYVALLGAPLAAGFVAREYGTYVTLYYSAAGVLGGGLLAAFSTDSTDRLLNLDIRCSAKHPSDSLWCVFVSLWQRDSLRLWILFSAVAISLVSSLSSIIAPQMLNTSAERVYEYGGYLAAASFGSVCGSIVYGLLGQRVKMRSLFFYGFMIIGLVMFGLIFFHSSPALLASGALLGLCASPLTAAVSVAIFERISIQQRGRALGVVSATLSGFTPLVMIVAGFGVEKFGVQLAFGTGAFVALVSLLNIMDFRNPMRK